MMGAPAAALCAQVGANMRGGVIDRSQFKIVYVAPMKALAAEVTATFSKRLSALGARVLPCAAPVLQAAVAACLCQPRTGAALCLVHGVQNGLHWALPWALSFDDVGLARLRPPVC